MGEFDIYIRQFLPKRAGAAVEGLERTFGLTPLQARELMHSVPRVVKHRVPASELARYERALAEIGAVYEIRPRAISPAPIIAVRGGPERVGTHESGTTLNLPAPRVDPASGARARPVSVPPPDPNRTLRADEPGADSEVAAPVASSADTLVEPTSTGTVVLHGASRPPPRDSVAPPGPAIRTQLEHRATPSPSVAPPRASAPPPAVAAGWQDFAPIEPETPRPAAPPSALAAWSDADVPASPHAPTVVASNEVVAAWQILEPVRWVPKQSSPPPRPSSPPPGDGPSPVATAWALLDAEPTPPVAEPAPRAVSVRPPPAEAPAPAVASDASPNPLDEVIEAPLLGERPARPRHPGAVAGPPVSRERPSAGTELPLDRAVLAATGSRRVPRATGVRDGGVRVEPAQRPLAWRITLRVALGCILFLASTGLRQFQPLGSNVERALARWNEGAVGDTHGLPALDWMRLGGHQFVVVDKDSVRSLVLELRAAGAVEVYVTDVFEAGTTSIARSLRVELPSGPGLRKNVLRVARAYAGDPRAFEDVGQPSFVLPL